LQRCFLGVPQLREQDRDRQLQVQERGTAQDSEHLQLAQRQRQFERLGRVCFPVRPETGGRVGDLRVRPYKHLDGDGSQRSQHLLATAGQVGRKQGEFEDGLHFGHWTRRTQHQLLVAVQTGDRNEQEVVPLLPGQEQR